MVFVDATVLMDETCELSIKCYAQIYYPVVGICFSLRAKRM